MAYLKEFEKQINNRDFPKLLEIWEEYCNHQPVDVKELTAILKEIRKSDFAQSFGKHVEMALPLWQTLEDLKESYEVLRLLIDLQTTNTPVLAEAAFQVLKAKYSEDPTFNEFIRLVGLRTRENFEGALRSYDLLKHMGKGKFVFHTGGWGGGEIVDYSTVREQLTIEFENVQGFRHFTFKNAFKSLEPLEGEHFLAKRFADPDAFEAEAKKDPVAVVKQLLHDLGPKTAGEIKDEMCVLIIPEEEWAKWWQAARSKLKKDPMIDAPTTVQQPFHLRDSEITQEEVLQEQFLDKKDISELIFGAYNFLRDLPKLKKNQEIRDQVKAKLEELIKVETHNAIELLQIGMILDAHFSELPEGKQLPELLSKITDISRELDQIEVVALKKRALILIREHNPEWEELFLSLFLTIQPAQLRDYVFGELVKESGNLNQTMEDLAQNPMKSPETVVWYFQKLMTGSEDLPLSDKEGLCRWFDAFLILMSEIEQMPEYRDLFKKMQNFITQKRYEPIRQMFEGASIEWVKEFLLLLSKCMTFTANDRKIFQSLAQVVHPSLGKGGPTERELSEQQIFWATEEAYNRMKDRAEQIGTIEMIQNAKEVETARELGDLRENAEYKYACEKRRQLQGELKRISEDLNKARILTANDVVTDKVSVGTVVTVADPKGSTSTYTILGPWDADVDNNILSTQSKFAQAMLGCAPGENFTFREEEYTLQELKNYFSK